MQNEVERTQAAVGPVLSGQAFSDVDTTADPAYFVKYLDSVGAGPVISALEELIVSRLQVKPGGRYLDVGCGTGDDLRAIAALAGPSGWIVGIDCSCSP